MWLITLGLTDNDANVSQKVSIATAGLFLADSRQYFVFVAVDIWWPRLCEVFMMIYFFKII